MHKFIIIGDLHGGPSVGSFAFHDQTTSLSTQEAIQQYEKEDESLILDQTFLLEDLDKHFNGRVEITLFTSLTRAYDKLMNNAQIIEGTSNIQTDISGIVLTMGHGDMSIISKIGRTISLEPYHSEMFKQLELMNKYLTDNKGLKSQSLEYNLEMNAMIEEYFAKSFEMPIFETFKHLPGYRYNNRLINQGHPSTYLPGIRAFYNSWLKEEFPGGYRKTK